jgi:hypothetical protein
MHGVPEHGSVPELRWNRAGRRITRRIGSQKFFIPGASSEEEALRIYGRLKNRLAEMSGAKLAGDRIFRIVHRLGQATMTAEVGRPHPHAGQTVVAILFEPRRNRFHVCTPTPGVNPTIPVRCEDVDAVELFDGD